MDGLLSDDTNTIAAALKEAIRTDIMTEAKIKAQEGVDYYKGFHQILNHQIFWIDSEDNLIEDTASYNSRISRRFLTELIDQKVQYLLSNRIDVDIEEDDEEFKSRLDEYYDADMHVFLQEFVEGASQKGFEYAFARTTSDDKLSFQVADSLTVFPVYDDNNVIQRIVRYYDKVIRKDNKDVNLRYATVWDATQVWIFLSTDGSEFVLDPGQTLNPRPIIVVEVEADDDSEQRADETFGGRDYGTIPFFRLSNNKYELTDLDPIKPHIDDFDMMNSGLSNNIQDNAESYLVVSGFQGNTPKDFDDLRRNLKTKKTIGTGEGGSLNSVTVSIPVEARKEKMRIDSENIYKDGMGVDTTAIGGGDRTTTVAIQGMFSLLNMKAKKTEPRLQTFLKWANELIVADINRRYNTNYDPKTVSFEFTFETPVNEGDIVANEKVEAETKQVEIQSILAVAPKLDSETVLKLICEKFDLDWEEVQKMIDLQGFTPGLSDGTDPETVSTALPDKATTDMPSATATMNTAEDIAGKTLNGAQTSSLINVVQQVAAGTLTEGQGAMIIARSIGVSSDEAKQILSGVL
jgi:SPP1 family phage portal protein